jgi:hypothetical protein
MRRVNSYHSLQTKRSSGDVKRRLDGKSELRGRPALVFHIRKVQSSNLDPETIN